MATRLDEPLAGAALNDTERRVVERIVGRLREALGDDLLAVWLYGSRARGEADPTETDFDRRSDVDLMAIVDSRRDAGELLCEVVCRGPRYPVLPGAARFGKRSIPPRIRRGSAAPCR